MAHSVTTAAIRGRELLERDIRAAIAGLTQASRLRGESARPYSAATTVPLRVPWRLSKQGTVLPTQEYLNMSLTPVYNQSQRGIARPMRYNITRVTNGHVAPAMTTMISVRVTTATWPRRCARGPVNARVLLGKRVRATTPTRGYSRQ